MMPAVATQHKEPTAADVAEPVALSEVGNTSECVRDLNLENQGAKRIPQARALGASHEPPPPTSQFRDAVDIMMQTAS